MATSAQSRKSWTELRDVAGAIVIAVFVVTAVSAGVLTAHATHPSAVQAAAPTPSLAAPPVDAKLGVWEKYLQGVFLVKPDVVRVSTADVLSDGNRIDLTVQSKLCPTIVNWEVSRDWQRGVGRACLYRGLRSCEAAGVILLVPDGSETSKLKILRCAAACKGVGLLFISVDNSGELRH